MKLSESAQRRLAGKWGGLEASLIRDSHFPTSSDLVEKFISKNMFQWQNSDDLTDQELFSNLPVVREVVEKWAERRISIIQSSQSEDALRAPLMFKTLLFSKSEQIHFASDGHNWLGKADIAKELSRYRPWSIRHAAAFYGGLSQLQKKMRRIVIATKSPTELKFFDFWWQMESNLDRPMLFPQVWGTVGGKFWLDIEGKHLPVHFDFGFVNSENKSKILIECDSMKYHSGSREYQLDRDRQNVAERLGWSVRRFTFQDVDRTIEKCFKNLYPDIAPYDSLYKSIYSRT
jgi:hypothetical protein